MKRAPFRQTVPAKYLRELLAYNPLTGIFTWKVNRGRLAKSGDVAGSISGIDPPYLRITINTHRYLAHRLAWFYVKGEWPEQLIDHRDGNSLNNAFENLRMASFLENTRNNSKRGYCLDNGLYLAYVYVAGEQIKLGKFPTEAEARAARDAGTQKYFGDFSSSHRGAQ